MSGVRMVHISIREDSGEVTDPFLQKEKGEGLVFWQKLEGLKRCSLGFWGWVPMNSGSGWANVSEAEERILSLRRKQIGPFLRLAAKKR